MQRAREYKSVRLQTSKSNKNSTTKIRKQRALLAASVTAIAGVAMVWANPAQAATLTWVGNVVDPASGGGAGSYTPSSAFQANSIDTPPANPYRWTTDATNWTGGAYTQGGNVVFTDNFSGGTAIRLSSSTLNPTSMTFSHIAGATPTNYVFLASGDYTWNAGANSLSSSSPWGTGNTFGSTLTLDTGFLGKVELRAGSSNVSSGTPNTIIRSGILQIDANNTVPALNNQRPSIELGGGQLWIEFNNIASTQLAGTLTVSDNSILALACSTTDARIYNGVVNVNAGKTLTIESLSGFVDKMSSGTFAGALSQGTIKLADVGANVTRLQLDSSSGNNAANNVTWDTGTGSSQLWFGAATGTFQLGALTGGANTFVRGNTSLTSSLTLNVGSKNIDTTFAGGISDTTVGATMNFVKSGNGMLVLTGGGGTGSGWTGSTTVSGGTLVLSGPNGAQNAASGTTIGLSSTLKLDNSAGNNSNRLPDGTGTKVSMAGGRLIFVGDRTTPTQEVAGQLSLGSGASHVQTIASGTGSNASITFFSLGTSTGGGTIDFSPASGVDINFTNAPATPNGIIGGFATANDTDWATITGVNNTVTTYSAYTPAANGSDPGTWLTTDNINITATSGLTVAANSNANSIKFSGSGGNISINSGQKLSVISGGLLVPAGSGLNPTISGLGSITAGNPGTVASLFARVPDASSTLTISSPIVDNTGGTVSLVKAGAGRLVLGGGNGYSGGTFLQEGTLVAGAANLFTGSLSIANNTTFDIGGFNQTLGALTLVSGALINTGGVASVTSTSGYNVQSGIISANIGGTVALTKSTAGTVILSGASNNYSGGTNVNGGTLQVTANNAIGAGALVVNGNAVLDIGSTNQSVSAVSVGSGNTATGTILGTGVLTSSSAFDLQNGTVNAVMAGAVGVGKNGIIKSSVVIGNTGNTYTGATTINGLAGNSPDGEIRVSHLANGGQPSSIGASSNANANLVLNGGNLVYVGTGDTTDRGLTLSANSRIVNSGSGPLVFSNTGAITTSGGSTLWLQGGNTGNNTFAMAIVGGGTQLNKSDAGTWILTNEGSTYDGLTSIQGGGILSVSKIVNGGSSSSIGQSSNDPSNLQFASNGGTLKYTGLSTSTDRLITLNANATLDSSGSGPMNWTNTGNLGGSGSVGINLTFGGSNTGNNIFSPAIIFGTSVVKTGSGTWTLNGALSYTGQTGAGTTVNAGTLILATNQTTQQDVNITGGKLQLDPNGGALRVIKTPTLEITGTGQLDIQNNKVIVNTTPTGTWNGSAYTDLTGLVASGRSGSTWTGSGIITGQAAAQNTNFTAVGIAKASDVLPATATATGLWAGQTITGSDTLVMYTYGGDATLDGKINVDDYIKIDSGIAAGLTGWSNGDFNLDGKVNIDDYTQFIDANIGTQGAQFPTAGGFVGGGAAPGVSAVPEPATLSILGIGATALLGRRRRRSR